jgi:hypothetical protein
MDVTAAIDRNHRALTRLVALMFAMVGLDQGHAVERLARPLYRAVLCLLCPAESAVRRLIVVAARGLAVKPRPPRPAPGGLNIAGCGHGRVSFQLFDPPERFAARVGRRRFARTGPEPRIRVIDATADPRIPLFRLPEPAAPLPDDGTVNAVPLCRRLVAIRSALEDLPRQVRRYARRLSRPAGAWTPQRAAALRPGPPPGLRQRPGREVDRILTECDGLARQAGELDTS